MPELPEVERAAKLLRDVASGKKITEVETSEDTIVYTGGITHTQFAEELAGRKIVDVKRYGKLFYMTLDGDGRMPVLHFGMTGMIQVKGEEPTWYRTRPKDEPEQWPPRFMKFIIHLDAEEGKPATQIAFRDARRLGRIRLCASPTTEPPISQLGFDPLLSMPTVEDFSSLIKKRNMPIKALLLDQEFSAGVGNWVADEILYQARVHPERRANALNDSEINELHSKMVYVCKTAVEANADASKFPVSWLFPHRWDKGKKGKSPTPLLLEDGSVAKIKWITVGGRTSAVVEQLQKVSGVSTTAAKRKSKAQSPDEESELSEAPPSESEAPKSKRPKRTAAAKDVDANNNDGDRQTPARKQRKQRKV